MCKYYTIQVCKALYSERLTAVIAAKDESNTYRLRGVNTISFSIHFQKCQKNMFPLCHYDLLCGDVLEKKNIFNPF
jgi:hypothetical protein